MEIKDLQKFKKRVGTEVREANLRAKEAHVGFVETSVEQRFFAKDLERLTKNTRWIIGILISVFFSIVGLVVTIIKFSGGK